MTRSDSPKVAESDHLMEGNTGHEQPYDYRNCQSLFGYAIEVHARSVASVSCVVPEGTGLTSTCGGRCRSST